MAGQLFSLFSLLWLVLSLAFGDQLAEFRNQFSDNPQLTERQKLKAKHERTLSLIRAVIENSATTTEAEAQLRKTEWPSRVLVIFIQEETGPYSELYSREVWTGITSFSKQGTGHGAMVLAKGRQDYVVLEDSAKALNKETLAYHLYVEDEEPE